ncbi:MAG TPA: hypothetical protein DG753_04980 [Clostridium sp.]|nr:hypothetical protein [Clostridium sp.]
MKFLNNNLKSKSSAKNTVYKKNLLIPISILLSLTILTCLTLTILVRKDIKTIMNSTSKITTKSINLWKHPKLIGTKDTDPTTKLSNITNKPNINSNNRGLISKITNKNITLQPIYLFNKQLPFYRKVNINKSPFLSFMSTIEVFYSISILLILSIIIIVLIIALLSRPVIDFFASLDPMYLFKRNKAANIISNEMDINSHDKITKNF